MIVIARSGNNNIWDIVTVRLGERPVPQSYFSTHAKPSADTEKVCGCGKMPLRPISIGVSSTRINSIRRKRSKTRSGLKAPD
jgi:hypothetical protein